MGVGDDGHVTQRLRPGLRQLEQEESWDLEELACRALVIPTCKETTRTLA